MPDHNRIQPYANNPFYWQYKGEPVLLLGGSVEDNLFQIPNIVEHLNLLKSVGGNYVRCTMSSRDEGDVWPFQQDAQTGLYDLNQPGVEYWRRFEQFLQLTAERDIIIQIEVWDRFDFSRDPWQLNPYNPKNNINYNAAESGLLEVITTHPGLRENAFFRSVPSLENNMAILPFQQAQVDRLLSLTLPYDHVLYCMDNETNESPEWPAFWAGYIQAQADAAGVTVQLTEMWDAHNLLDPQHNATFDHPEIYSFVDISQNNHQPSAQHWQNLIATRQRIIDSGHVRPMNNVKIYGANTGQYGSGRDSQERFWRNIFGGLASSRFHRPDSGHGLNHIAQAHIQSMRMFTDALGIFTCQPHNDLLSNRSWNEAYCTADPGRAYGVFFTDGGDVRLDVSAAAGKTLRVRWLDIRRREWHAQSTGAPGADGLLRLVSPEEEGYWAALVIAS